MQFGERLRSPINPMYGGQPARPFARYLRAVDDGPGWLVLLLLLVTAGCLPAAVQEIQWLDNVAILWPTALLALVAGIVMGERHRRPWVEAVVGLVIGWLGVFLVMGRILPTWRRVGENSQAIAAWLGQPITRHAAPDPFPHIILVVLQRIGGFSQQIVTWAQSGGSGQAAIDNRIFLFLLAISTWGVTFYLVWALYRGMNPVSALTPFGVTLITLVVLGGQGMHEVVVFLICAFLLMMRLHIQSLEQRWNRHNVDYPGSVSAELFFTGAVFTVMIAVIALVVPAAPQNALAVAFWGFFNGPWSGLEANVGEAFTGVRHKVGGNAGNDLFLGGALGVGANTTVMYVKTDEPPPPDLPEEQLQAMGYTEPVHYYQGAAFTEYSGTGWGNTGKIVGRSHFGVAISPNGQPVFEGVGHGPQAQEQNRQANQPINPAIPGATKVVQQVQKVEDPTPLLYAYAVPVRVDQPTTVHALGGAQTRIDLSNNAKTYTVVSDVLSPTAPQLRAAGTAYPSWISPYLQLPPIPSRVRALAIQWSAAGGTPYDKATLIQNQLRKLPYSTDIPAPPRGRDAVDYFLFDAKQGYCEYFASAMVVMSRSIGVPARVVSGYATTTYNRTRREYQVDEADAHTWVQVYFPGVGWVDFEPTPLNPAITRPEGATGPPDQGPVITQLPPPPVQASFLPQIDRRVVVGAVLLGLAILLAYAVRRQWEAELTAEAMVVVVYGRLCRYGRWFGQPRLPHETPLEYGYRLADRFALVAEPVADQIRRIGVLFVFAQYGGQPLGSDDKETVKRAWLAVRGHLWELRRMPRHAPAVVDEA